MLISCPLGGWIADKTGMRKKVFSICLGLISLWWIFVFRLPITMIPFMMILFGLISGPIISTIIIALPDVVKRPELIGYGMSILMFWHHLGEFIGPLYFGKILDITGSWIFAAVLIVPVCLIGCIAGLIIKIR